MSADDNCFTELFMYMPRSHDVNLLESDMAEIVDICDRLKAWKPTTTEEDEHDTCRCGIPIHHSEEHVCATQSSFWRHGRPKEDKCNSDCHCGNCQLEHFFARRSGVITKEIRDDLLQIISIIQE